MSCLSALLWFGHNQKKKKSCLGYYDVATYKLTKCFCFLSYYFTVFCYSRCRCWMHSYHSCYLTSSWISSLKKKMFRFFIFATKYGTKIIYQISKFQTVTIDVQCSSVGTCFVVHVLRILVWHFASCTAAAWLVTLYQPCSFISNKESAGITQSCLVIH